MALREHSWETKKLLQWEEREEVELRRERRKKRIGN
jgi:hypothetical protein